jgi:hypothetical protein
VSIAEILQFVDQGALLSIVEIAVAGNFSQITWMNNYLLALGYFLLESSCLF